MKMKLRMISLGLNQKALYSSSTSCYTSLLLNPIRPTKQEPTNQTVPGMETGSNPDQNNFLTSAFPVIRLSVIK